jgi:hypothetical protein
MCWRSSITQLWACSPVKAKPILLTLSAPLPIISTRLWLCWPLNGMWRTLQQP